jgi:hypothetical protein
MGWWLTQHNQNKISSKKKKDLCCFIPKIFYWKTYINDVLLIALFEISHNATIWDVSEHHHVVDTMSAGKFLNNWRVLKIVVRTGKLWFLSRSGMVGNIFLTHKIFSGFNQTNLSESNSFTQGNCRAKLQVEVKRNANLDTHHLARSRGTHLSNEWVNDLRRAACEKRREQWIVDNKRRKQKICQFQFESTLSLLSPLSRFPVWSTTALNTYTYYFQNWGYSFFVVEERNDFIG